MTDDGPEAMAHRRRQAEVYAKMENGLTMREAIKSLLWEKSGLKTKEEYERLEVQLKETVAAAELMRDNVERTQQLAMAAAFDLGMVIGTLCMSRVRYFGADSRRIDPFVLTEGLGNVAYEYASGGVKVKRLSCDVCHTEAIGVTHEEGLTLCRGDRSAWEASPERKKWQATKNKIQRELAQVDFVNGMRKVRDNEGRR